MSASVPASAFPVAVSWPERGGELVQSLTYQQSYVPAAAAASSSVYDPPARRSPVADAPWLLRTLAGGAWALVSLTAAGSVLVVLILLVVRLVGWLA